MTTDYVAWNDRAYPWPPPEGWYEADDGRWWAPGSGPNPDHPQDRADSDSDSSRTVPEDSTNDESVGTGSAGGNSTGGDSSGNNSARRDSAAGGPVENNPGRGESSSTSDKQTVIGARPGSATDTPPRDRPEVGTDPGANRSSLRPKLLVGGLAALIVVAAFVLIASRGGDDDANQNATETQDPATTTEAATSSTTALEVTTEAPATTATTAPSSTTTIPDEIKVQTFRTMLQTNDLGSDQLTDADIIEFGAAFCVFATVSEDKAGFDELRAEAIADSSGDLNPEEMAIAIDAAVVAFCPAEAERLTLSS